MGQNQALQRPRVQKRPLGSQLEAQQVEESPLDVRHQNLN